MPNNINIIQDEGIIKVDGFDISGSSNELESVIIKEILMTESLLTQSPQMAVILHSAIYQPPGKWFDKWKNKDISFNLSGMDQQKQAMSLAVKQKVYRLSDRKFMPTNVGQTEQMTVHAVDETLFKDAQKLVSKSWKCTQPSKIVEDVLSNCVEAKNKEVQSADPARDYIAENIHPYQVIAQQANVALDGDDPSFVHFMTYENGGKHYFKSLKSMASAGSDPARTFHQTDYEANTGYSHLNYAVNFMFPCDFDYLSDLLNGLNESGSNQNSGGFLNPVMKQANQMGSNSGGCSQLGGYNYKEATSNKSSAEQQNSCNTDVESHLLKRQARMGLLDRDKVALRITVPCNLNLHAGQVITLVWKNKKAGTDTPVYGNGDYLIASMTHNIKLGGYSVTTMDCVSTSVSQGVV